MISFTQLFLQTLAVSLLGVACLTGILYVFWNCMTADKKEKKEEEVLTFYTCQSSFSLMRPLVARNTAR